MKKTLKYILVAIFATIFCAPAFADKDPKEAIKTGKSIVVDPTTGDMRLRLETFVTGDGENKSTVVTTYKPMDIVLVLDVSGSMEDELGKTNGYRYVGDVTSTNVLRAFRNSTVYSLDQNGEYKPVSISRDFDYDSWSYVYSYKWTNNSTRGTIRALYVNRKEQKIDALKTAVDVFVDIIHSNAQDNKVNHRISVVKFADDSKATDIGDDFNGSYNYTQIVKALTDDYASVKSAVRNLVPAGATSADFAMDLAKDIIDGIDEERAKESVKTIVFFTDGEPNHGSGWSGTVANSAINTAQTLKSNKVTIYSLGVFSSATDNMKTFLNTLSSNDKTSTSMPTARNISPNGFYLMASSASELVNAFEKISTEMGQGEASKADYVLETKTTVLRDIITPSFQIPDGGTVTFKVDSIRTIAGEDPDKVYTWIDSEEDAHGVSYTKRVDSGKTYVDVKGYNFNDHWVGYIHKIVDGVEDKSKRTVHGQKLIIYIDIEPSAENEGGAEQTNAVGSGILINGSEVVPFDQSPIKDYEIKDLVTVRPVNLTIRKSGLQPGESVIYTVTRSNDPSFKRTVVLTAGADGTAEGKVKVDAWPGANKSSLYTYTVKEDNTWAYEYKPTEAKEGSHALYDSSFELTNVFTFGAPEESGHSEGVTKRGEDAKNNIFTYGRAQ